MLYCKIGPNELLGQAWSKRREPGAPNVLAMIKSFNEVMLCVCLVYLFGVFVWCVSCVQVTDFSFLHLLTEKIVQQVDEIHFFFVARLKFSVLLSTLIYYFFILYQNVN